MRRNVVIGAACSLATCVVVSIAIFTYANNWATETKNTEAHSAAENIVRELAKINGYQINGTFYDSGTIDKELNRILQSNQDYLQKRDSLIQLYNSSYDTCGNNIDAYLDWYYPSSFPSNLIDPVRREAVRIFNREQAEEDELREYQNQLTSNVDFEKIKTETDSYNQIIWSAKDQLQNQLSASPIYNIPDWLIYEEKSFDDYFQSRCVNPAFQVNYPEGEYPDREAFKQGILDSLQRERESVVNTIKLNQ